MTVEGDEYSDEKEGRVFELNHQPNSGRHGSDEGDKESDKHPLPVWDQMCRKFFHFLNHVCDRTSNITRWNRRAESAAMNSQVYVFVSSDIQFFAY